MKQIFKLNANPFDLGGGDDYTDKETGENKIVPEPGEDFIPEATPPFKEKQEIDKEKGSDARNINPGTHQTDKMPKE